MYNPSYVFFFFENKSSKKIGTFKFLKKFSMRSSVASYGRFPMNAVYGGWFGIRPRSTSGPRAALGAVGNLDLSIIDRCKSKSKSAK